MGTGLVVIDVILIAIVILPFVLFISGSKKKKRKLKKALQTLATEHKCTLTKTEIHSNFAIGIDATAQKLFFYKQNEGAVTSKVVDLTTVKTCKFIKQAKRVKDQSNKYYDVIDSVLLSFKYFNKGADTNFVLYDNDEDLGLSEELTLGLKWQDFINKHLSLNAKGEQYLSRDQVALT